jgi:flagellar hook-basal body complex protein FliE
MTGIDLPGLGGFDPLRYQQQILRAASTGMQDVQDPEKVRRALTPNQDVPTESSSTGFAGFLADSLDNVQALQDDSRAKTRGLALGEDVDLHDVMIASSKSEAAFNLVLEVRNKLVEAWEKLSRSVM